MERNVYAYIAHKLGCEIVGGVFPPGTLLPNKAEMRARFAVSRTALREAYSVLVAKGHSAAPEGRHPGLLQEPTGTCSTPRCSSGTWKRYRTRNSSRSSTRLRQMVEPEAAALAAAGPSPATIEQIGAAYADMVRFKDGAGDLISADLRFHLGILNATDNHFVGAFGSRIYAALFSTFRLSWEGAARIRDNRLHSITTCSRRFVTKNRISPASTCRP